MPIIKFIVTGNGNAAAARLEQATLKKVMGGPGEPYRQELQLQVHLYPSIEDARSGSNLMWQLYPSLPPDVYDPADPFGSLERALIAAPGDFAGGAFAPHEVVSTLDDAKAAKWAQIKALRIQKEDGGFDMTEVGRIQSDPESRAKIVGAGLAAKIAKDAAQIYSVPWTLADNTTFTMNADTMINAGFELLAHLDSLHQQSRVLFDRIQAAETQEAVADIAWISHPESEPSVEA